MTTYDTTFVGAADGLTADNLLKPAKGEINLLARDSNNFVALQADIDNNSLYDLGALGAQTTPTANLFSADLTAPTILSAVRVSATSYTVTLSENMDAASVTKSNAGGFVVAETGAPSTAYAVSATAPGVTANKITLTVADTSASTLAGVTITYTAGGNGTAKDVAGNVLATNATGVTAAA